MASLKLGLQLGYWGAGPPANAPELVAEAERLGFDSVWTAEAYGSDALTPLAWWGSRTTTGPPRHRPVPAVGADAHGHGHGGADARPPLRRVGSSSAWACRARRSWRAGTASRSRSLWPAPASTSRSSARSSPARRPSTNAGPHYPLPYPGGHGTGQAAQAHRPPAAQRHPHRPRGRRAEERRPGGRDRRRLVPDLLLARPHGRVHDRPRRGVRPARGARTARRTSRSSPSAPSSSTTTSSAPPICTGPCWPCTSAGWAPRR